MAIDDVVEERLTLLDEYITDLKGLNPASLLEYREKKLMRKAAERLLQTAVEACLDIGNHLIAAEGFRAPIDNKDVFQVLADERVVPAELLGRLQDMARFRNLLVHDYARIDDAVVYVILTRRLGDFDEFARAIVAHLQKAPL